MLCLCHCTAVRTETRDASSTVKLARQNVIISGEVGDDVAQIIRMSGLTPEDAIKTGGQFLDADLTKQQFGDFQLHIAKTEILLAQAMKLEHDHPDQAARAYLAVAQLSLQGMWRKECALDVILP